MRSSLPRILLVNPPINDFSAYDFWMKPFGLLRVAGQIRNQADFLLFDFMDRHSSYFDPETLPLSDPWGRGHFFHQEISKPPELKSIRRKYKRMGVPRKIFQEFLQKSETFDFVMIQTVMTYWYLGVKEVIEDIRHFQPQARIILGGVYATLCFPHASSLDSDLVIQGLDLTSLWKFLNFQPEVPAMPLWDLYPRVNVGVLKLAEGCPFRCTYCSVPQVFPPFYSRTTEESLNELEFLLKLGAKNVVFYDDALLYQPRKILIPFLQAVLSREMIVNFHTPNALNARFITMDIAQLMIRAGFKTFYLGFESSAYEWQKKTGGKVYSNEFERAIQCLHQAGADLNDVTAYLIMGHPHMDQQNLEASMEFAHQLGIRIMLSEFSPIPGTPDGEECRKWVNLDEPLYQNKTVFPIIYLGESEVNRLKRRCQELNHKLNQRNLVPDDLPQDFFYEEKKASEI